MRLMWKKREREKKEYLMCIENEGIHGVCKTVRHSLFVCAVSIVAVQYKRFYIFIISIAESYTKSMVQFKKKSFLFAPPPSHLLEKKPNIRVHAEHVMSMFHVF